MIAELKKIFSKFPGYAPVNAQEKWKKEGPLKLDDYIKQGKVLFDESLEIKEISDFYHG